MKKILFLLALTAGVAFGAEDQMLSSYTSIAVYAMLAAGFVLGVAAAGGAVAMGNAASATITGIARNPSVASKLSTTMYISLAMIEAQVIYALVICFVLLFANPMLTDTLSATVG
ncbi:MAG: F0F1 ATP synthase subunit C [Campylobacter sp.]|nr:F0F1 ATP synthase subunit C [Campylobacter sp.]